MSMIMRLLFTKKVLGDYHFVYLFQSNHGPIIVMGADLEGTVKERITTLVSEHP